MRAMNLYLAATFAVVALLFVGTAVLTGMASTWLMALAAAALAVANAAALGEGGD